MGNPERLEKSEQLLFFEKIWTERVEGLKPTERALAVARSIYLIEMVIYSYVIPWEDIGPQRRLMYIMRAQAALEALDLI